MILAVLSFNFVLKRLGLVTRGSSLDHHFQHIKTSISDHIGEVGRGRSEITWKAMVGGELRDRRSGASISFLISSYFQFLLFSSGF